MKKSYVIRFKPLIISLLISLGVGALSGFLTKGSMKIYQSLIQPPLAPPPWVFPVVWTVLYILMGISAYLVFMSHAPEAQKATALTIYALQLAVNFIWPILFFNLGWILFAFFWLLLLIVLIVWMIVLFRRVSPLAAYLQVPYLVWTIFAGYLNWGVYLLNR